MAEVDYDRRKPRPINHIFEAHDAHDPTKTSFLLVARDEDDTGAIVHFVEDTGVPGELDVIAMMWIDADQCEEFGNALLASAKILRERK